MPNQTTKKNTTVVKGKKKLSPPQGCTPIYMND